MTETINIIASITMMVASLIAILASIYEIQKNRLEIMKLTKKNLTAKTQKSNRGSFFSRLFHFFQIFANNAIETSKRLSSSFQKDFSFFSRPSDIVIVFVVLPAFIIILKFICITILGGSFSNPLELLAGPEIYAIDIMLTGLLWTAVKRIKSDVNRPKNISLLAFAPVILILMVFFSAVGLLNSYTFPGRGHPLSTTDISYILSFVMGVFARSFYLYAVLSEANQNQLVKDSTRKIKVRP